MRGDKRSGGKMGAAGVGWGEGGSLDSPLQ